MHTELNRVSQEAQPQNSHVQWQADSKWPVQSASAQPAAMRSLEPALPSMPETSAASQEPEPAAIQQRTADPAAEQTLHRQHQPHQKQAVVRTCLKHAGIGGESPPQARETALPSAAAAPLHTSSQLSTAHLQSTSTQGASQSAQQQEAAAPEPAAEFVSAFSGASLLQDEGTLRRQSGSSVQSTQEQWPDTCSWTVPCHVYNYRTVTFNFDDPSLPGVLQPAINVSLTLTFTGLRSWV